MNLVCGINPVLEALNAGTRQFDRLLIAKGLRNRRVAEAISRATHMGVPLRFESRAALDHMAHGVNHQGIIAVVSAKPVIDLDGLLTQAHDPALIVVLDGVEDPRNLGAIVRTVEAAGADGLVLPERHTAPLSETVSRASAGALEYVRVARIGNLAQAIETMKARGLWLVGFDATGTERWHAPDYRRASALVFGGEGRGIRRLVRERCDQIVALPLFGQVASLNVSVAVGAALYEVVRQRGFVPSHVRPIPARPATRTREIIGPNSEDSEEDPGRIGPPLDVAVVAGDVSVEISAIEPQPHTISVIDLHEEVAWDNRGNNAPPEGGGGDRRVRRPLEGRRGQRPQTAERVSVPRDDARVAGDDAQQTRPRPGGGRHRRRRRRGRPAGPIAAGVEAVPRPPSDSESAAEGGIPAAPAGSTGANQRPHRRRRRRRH
jgi:23S rRNA (guanosine2251-2'-O)-methyltransferase